MLKTSFAFRRANLIPGLVVTLMGAAVLAGWCFQIPVLKSIVPGVVPMKANTALGMLLCGIQLLVLAAQIPSKRPQVYTTALAITVILLGAASLSEDLFDFDLGIDHQIIQDKGLTTDSSHPGRMSPTTAFCFILSGLALGLAALPLFKKFRRPLLFALATALMLVGILALVGYASDTLFGYRWWNYTGMAIHTAFGFIGIAMGVVASERGNEPLEWSLDRLPTIGFIAGIALLLIAAGIVFNSSKEMIAAAGWVSHTQEVLKELREITTGMAELESNQRGYLILGTENLLVTRNTSKQSVQENLDNVTTLTRDNPRQQVALQNLRTLIDRRNAFGDETIAVRSRQGFTPAQQLLSSGPGMSLTLEIASSLNAMVDEENRLLDGRVKHLRRISASTFLLLPLGVFLSVTLLLVGLFFLNSGISDRKYAEQSLHKKEEQFHETDRRLAEIVQGMTEACFALDDQWRFTFVNAQVQTLLRHSRDQMLGRSIWEVFNKLVGTPMEKHYRHAMAERVPVSFEAFSPIADRWLDIRIFPSGNGLAAFLLDIDERKTAEKTLLKLQSRLQSTLSAGSVGTWTWDIGNDCLVSDEFTARMFSIEPDAAQKGLPAEAYLKAVFEEDQLSVSTALAEAIKACSQYDIEYRVHLKNGEFRWLQARGRVDRDAAGSASLFHGAVMDITERKRAAEALSESQEQFRTMVDAMSQLAWMAQPNGSIYWYNQRWFEFTGTTLEQMDGWGWQRVHDPDALPKVLDRWKESITLGQPFEMNFPLRAADGRFHWFLTRAFPLKDANGRVIRWIGTNTDVSRMREVEEQIQNLNVELEQRVIERTAELESANKELEAFSYSVSHDLRAPLRAVDGFSRAVLEDFGPQLPEDGKGYLQNIRQGAQQMGNLIDDLLRFSRLSRALIKKDTIDTTRLVRDVIEDLDDQCIGRKVDLQIGELPVCQGDSALLRQVWINLLSNAIKYTSKRDASIIEIGSITEDAKTTYFVRDNGTGFDMRYADKLFGVFQRLHRAEDYEGTGVGLAIVNRIIVRHGGRIWADAVLDRGATFYFTLEEGLKS